MKTRDREAAGAMKGSSDGTAPGVEMQEGDEKGRE